MIFTLKNDRLSISVSDLGAELQSLTAVNSNEEYLWQGDSKVWSGRAPVLFPIVGALKNSQMRVGGKTYTLLRHGFVRHATFECIKNDPQQLLLQIKSDSESRLVYPWDFTLEVGFALDGNRLEISYSVTHSGPEARENMLFTIGSHPAFCLPLSDLPMDHFSIRFSHDENLLKYPLDAAGLLAVKGEPFSLKDNRLELQKNTFKDDALVFKDIKSTAISLWQGETERVRVNTGGAPHLGLWAKPGAAYVCIEPWLGYSDAVDASGHFTDKPGLKSLAVGESFHTNWSIELPSI